MLDAFVPETLPCSPCLHPSSGNQAVRVVFHHRNRPAKLIKAPNFRGVDKRYGIVWKAQRMAPAGLVVIVDCNLQPYVKKKFKYQFLRVLLRFHKLPDKKHEIHFHMW